MVEWDRFSCPCICHAVDRLVAEKQPVIWRHCGMKYSKKKIAITIFILCIFWVLAKSFHLPYDDNNPPPPPITMPFAEHKAGETIAFKVRINEPHSYSFFLCFRYREGDQADRARVDKLTGWFRTDKSGRLIEPGIPIPLRLTVFKVDTDGQHLFFTKEISEFPVSSWR